MRGAIPITSPRFSLEDEERELANLAAEDLEEAQADIFGRKVEETEETDEVKRRGSASVAEALQMIPAEEKESYLRALERCPGLVETESEPVRFLRSTTYNPWEAASRLAKYWKKRQELFGARAFMPLTISGRGAMCPQAVDLLASGVLTCLPNDSKGRAVVFYDRRHIDTSNDYRRLWLQAFFYVLSSAIDASESAQKNGIVVVVYAVGWRGGALDRKLLRDALRLVNSDEVPWKLRALHVCCPFAKPRSPIIMPIAKFLAGKYIRLRMKTHYGSDGEILCALETFGFEAKHLPTILCGDWHLESRHERWMQSRREL